MSRIDPMLRHQTIANAGVWGAQVVEELTGFEYEARCFPRTKLTAEILVRATNGGGCAFGTRFKAITTDISPGGMGFLHITAVPDKFLAITLGQNGRRASVLAEVVRCRSVGNLYEVGVKFIRPLETPEV